MNTRFRLSAMMFLEYGVWGAWTTVGAVYFQDLGFGDTMISWLFAALWLACIIAPFIGGQIADRYFPTQRFLAISHLLGAVLLFLMAIERSFPQMMWWMSIYCLLYAPTLALTNSICFHHLKNVDEEFGRIRVWGTLGWIAAGWILTLWRSAFSFQVLGDLFYVAALGSFLLGILSFFLPNTPPRREAESPFAFLEAIRLLKDRNFAVFMLIAFVVTTELQFYYIPTSIFLQDLGVSGKYVPAIMTLAQIAEILAMWLLLPRFLRSIGLRWTLALGVIAWPLRYVVFAIGEPLWLVVLSLAFHGIGFTFFFVTSQIYVDRVASADIRASAQSLLTLVTLGVGNYLGTMFYAYIKVLMTENGVTDWTDLFLVPCALTGACAIAYLLLFRPAGQSTGSHQLS